MTTISSVLSSALRFYAHGVARLLSIAQRPLHNWLYTKFNGHDVVNKDVVLVLTAKSGVV